MTTAFVVPERQLFLPSLGFAILAACFAEWLLWSCLHRPPRGACGGRHSRQPSRRWYLGIAAVAWAAVVLALARRTWTRNLDWHDEHVLLRRNLEVFPMNSMCL